MSVTKQITRSGCSVQITLDDGGEVQITVWGDAADVPALPEPSPDRFWNLHVPQRGDGELEATHTRVVAADAQEIAGLVLDAVEQYLVEDASRTAMATASEATIDAAVALLPVATLRLDTLTALGSLGAYTAAGSGWAVATSGSTPTASTGPGTNSAGPYVHTEASGTDALVAAGTVTLLSSVLTAWSGAGRMLTLRACLQGTFGSDEGLQLSATIDGAEHTAPLFVGWAYSDSNDADDTISDAASVEQSCAQDGGWVDFSWAVPDGALTALTIAPALTAEEETQDIALWEVTFVGLAVPSFGAGA